MKVAAGSVQVSGVVLAQPANHVLTTSVSLGAGPLVTVTADSGQTFTGWIVGRNDGNNLALIRVVGGTLPGVEFGDSLGVAIGTEVLFIGYPLSRPEGSVPVEGTVTAVRTDFASGARFFRIDIPPVAGISGGPVFNRNGQVIAINVESSYVQSLGLPTSDESFAKAEDMVRPSIEALAEGAVSLTAPRPTPTPDPGSPPPLPVTIKGTATANGTGIPAGARVYARLFGTGLLDIWFSVPAGENSAYEFLIGVVNPVYTNGTIEFYYEGVKSGTTVSYQPGQIVQRELSFP